METCKKHRGRKLKMFCRDHDTACCNVCVVEGHRTCHNLEDLPEPVSDNSNDQTPPTATTEVNGAQEPVPAFKLESRVSRPMPVTAPKPKTDEVTPDLAAILKARKQRAEGDSAGPIRQDNTTVQATVPKQKSQDIKPDLAALLSARKQKAEPDLVNSSDASSQESTKEATEKRQTEPQPLNTSKLQPTSRNSPPVQPKSKSKSPNTNAPPVQPKTTSNAPIENPPPVVETKPQETVPDLDTILNDMAQHTGVEEVKVPDVQIDVVLPDLDSVLQDFAKESHDVTDDTVAFDPNLYNIEPIPANEIENEAQNDSGKKDIEGFDNILADMEALQLELSALSDDITKSLEGDPECRF